MTEKLYRAIVIDPVREVVDIVITDGSLKHIGEVIGAESFDSFRIADHAGSYDYAWVDDEGLARGEPIHAFLFSVRQDPIAGRCMLIGATKEGGITCDALFPLTSLRAVVTWLGRIKPEVTWVATETGGRAIVTYSRVP
jgi:hypothetical protein